MASTPTPRPLHAISTRDPEQWVEFRMRMPSEMRDRIIEAGKSQAGTGASYVRSVLARHFRQVDKI